MLSGARFADAGCPDFLSVSRPAATSRSRGNQFSKATKDKTLEQVAEWMVRIKDKRLG